MGTNFYFYADSTEYQHIGKRSAAGLYCWDCGVSLCSTAEADHTWKLLYGAAAVHHIRGHWLDECWLCGKTERKESLTESAPGRELGFNQNKPGPKQGVASCASFTWAISPIRYADLKTAPNITIRNEYGQIYTQDEFVDVLKECPIQIWNFVNREFS